MFLNGSAMEGGALHDRLTGMYLLEGIATAEKYAFYSIRDEFPGLYPSSCGGAIAGELYSLSYEVLRDTLLPSEPPELELGVIELEDGTATLSMLLRTDWLRNSTVSDITRFGGWRAYLRQLGRDGARF
jgi:gamma-glutamylcyclotransferase (GGCT)/AIG2-like uncharacterized protein YtfP